MQDDRKGLSSASSMHRAASCPGSPRLEATSPQETESEDAARGTRIHDFIAGEGVSLSPSELETAQVCIRMGDEALRLWAGPNPAEVINREERLWFYGPHGEPLFSGRPDLVYQQGSRALVIDWKTGHSEPDPAEVNWQLRALAVLVAENWPADFEEVAVCMIAPHVSREVSLITYECDDLLQAREEILGICEKTRDPNAKRIPGESQCRHCRGKLRCPELRAHLAMVQAHITPVDLLPEDLAQLLDIASAAKHMIAAAESEAKRRLAENPESIPGWMLKEGAKVRHVEDPEAVYNALEGHVNHEGFLSCVEVKIGALEKLVVENTADCFPTKKAARENFNECVAPYITLKQNAPSLKRVKELPL